MKWQSGPQLVTIEGEGEYMGIISEVASAAKGLKSLWYKVKKKKPKPKAKPAAKSTSVSIAPIMQRAAAAMKSVSSTVSQSTAKTAAPAGMDRKKIAMIAVPAAVVLLAVVVSKKRK